MFLPRILLPAQHFSTASHFTCPSVGVCVWKIAIVNGVFYYLQICCYVKYALLFLLPRQKGGLLFHRIGNSTRENVPLTNNLLNIQLSLRLF